MPIIYICGNIYAFLFVIVSDKEDPSACESLIYGMAHVVAFTGHDANHVIGFKSLDIFSQIQHIQLHVISVAV